MRMGWIGEAGEVVCEPVPGVNSRLKCRGQVIATTKNVTYEVTLKELGYRPEPYCIADALMYADGKPIVEITNMSLRMSGLTKEKLEVSGRAVGVSPLFSNSRLTPAALQCFTTPLPSSRSRTASRRRRSASRTRFSTPSASSRDCPGRRSSSSIAWSRSTGEPFVLKAGAACEAEYDVPPDAWYFDANRGEMMPFAVLLEIALQPCGWLAAYCGSALVSPEDLSFRNLGGKATQFRPVTPESGTLTTSVKMTSVSNSAGMIIQHYDMSVRDRVGDVYTRHDLLRLLLESRSSPIKSACREAKVPWPSEARAHRERSKRFCRTTRRSPHRCSAWSTASTPSSPMAGQRGLGLVVGKIAVDPAFWFFKAHFYQDPVWPGSLGVESFLQLLKFAAWKRWGEPGKKGWQSVALNRPHTWSYRGQVVPRDKEVVVVLEVTAVDDHNQRLSADGFLTVDGRVIYQLTDFSLE